MSAFNELLHTQCPAAAVLPCCCATCAYYVGDFRGEFWGCELYEKAGSLRKDDGAYLMRCPAWLHNTLDYPTAFTEQTLNASFYWDK